MNSEDEELRRLIKRFNEVGNKRYNRLTNEDLEKYKRYELWRFVNGKNRDDGTTLESNNWVRDNSEKYCPICEKKYSSENGRSIDHKLPRAQYPWLSMEFKNLWVICFLCNQEKAEMNWYEYELYMLTNHPELYLNVRSARPIRLIESLKG